MALCPICKKPIWDNRKICKCELNAECGEHGPDCNCQGKVVCNNCHGNH